MLLLMWDIIGLCVIVNVGHRRAVLLLMWDIIGLCVIVNVGHHRAVCYC